MLRCFRTVHMEYSSSGNLKHETQKFAFVSRTFLFKTMECVYQVRCTDQVADFIPDEENWFMLDVPKSVSLRQKISSQPYHGWFSIDISVSGTSDVVERWYLMHLPVKQTDSVPSLSTNLKELKAHTYREFAQTLRSVYSMLHCLPAYTLSYYLSGFRTAKQSLVASTTSFQKFPAKLNSFCDDETAKLKFGPVVTPLGRTLVICQYRVDVTGLVPSPIRTAPRYNFPRVETPPVDEGFGVSESREDTYGQSFTESIWNMTPVPAVNLDSFVSSRFVDGFELIEEPGMSAETQREDKQMTLDEFAGLMRDVDAKHVPTPVTVDQVLANYTRVQDKLRALTQ